MAGNLSPLFDDTTLETVPLFEDLPQTEGERGGQGGAANGIEDPELEVTGLVLFRVSVLILSGAG